MNNNEEFVTEEEIQKAMDELQNEMFTSDEEIDDILKAEDEDEDEDEDEAPTNAKVDDNEDEDEDMDEDMDKGYSSCKGYSNCYSKGGKYYHKGKGGKMMEISKEDMEEYKEEKGMMKKGEEDDFSIADDEEFEKALEISPVVARLNETLTEVEEATSKKFGSVGTILKGLSEQINSLQESIDGISKQSQGRKSVGVGSVPRFDDNVEKGGDAEAKVVSLSRDRNKVLDIMDGMTFSKGFDNDMSKAMSYYEANGVINTQTAVRIEKETGYKVVQ